MSDTIHSATLRITGDSTEAVAAIAQVEKRVDNLAVHATAAGKNASDGVKQIGSGAADGAKGIERATQSAIGAIQRATAAQNAGRDASIAYAVELSKLKGVNQTALEPHIATFNASTRAMIQARQEAARMNGVMSGVGMSAKQTAFAMRGIPAQMTDIVVSLQGGQRPMTVLMQQGGQLKDMFGGIGPAARAMGTYVAGIAPLIVHPFTLGIAAAAAFGMAIYQAKDQLHEVSRALISSGNYVGMTKLEVVRLGDEIGKTTGRFGDAREAVQALAESGRFAGGQMKVIGTAMVDASVVTGQAIADLKDKFKDIVDDPKKFSEEWQKAHHIFSADTMKKIDDLDKLGLKQQASTLLIAEFAAEMSRRRPQVEEDMGYIQRGWKQIKESIGAATLALMEFGRENKAKQIAQWQQSIAEMETAIKNGNNTKENLEPYLKNAREALATLQDQEKAEKANASAKAASTQAEIKKTEAEKAHEKFMKDRKGGTAEWAIKEEKEAWENYSGALQKGSKEYEEAYAAHLKKIADIKKRFAPKKESNREENYYANLVSSIKSKTEASQLEIDTDGKALDSQKMRIKFLQDLANKELDLTGKQRTKVLSLLDEYEATERLNKQKKYMREYEEDRAKSMREMITGYDDEIAKMGMTEREAEKLTVARQLMLKAEEAITQGRKNAAISDDQIAKIRTNAAADTAAAFEKINQKYDRARDPWARMSDSLRQYADEASNYGNLAANAMTNSIRSMEDALVSFVQTGKMNWRSLANSIIGEIARIQIKALLSGIFGNGSSGVGLFGMLGGLFGGTPAAASGSVLGAGGLTGGATINLAGKFASGGDFGGGLRLVGERGPELEATGPSRIFNANQTRDILSGARSGGVGQTIHFSPVYNVDARSDRAQVISDMDRMTRGALAEFEDRMTRQGRLAA